MFLRTRFLFFCLALPLLTKCIEAEKPKHVYRFDFDNEQQAQQVLSSLSVNCETPGSCPEASGGLFFIETTKSYYSTSYNGGTCSQTLIAPNKVLTNRHCLPANALSRGAACANVTVFFPATLNKPVEKIVCKSVLDLSASYTATDSMHPDWAVLELVSDSTRNPVSTNTDGIPKDTVVNAFPVYYSRTSIQNNGNSATFSITGKIRKISCTSKMNSAYSTYYVHAQNPLVSLVCDTEVIHGNSGTGILSADQRLMGAISMAVKKNESVGFMGESLSLDNKYAGGTNAHCITNLNQQASPACAFDDKNERQSTMGDWFAMIYAKQVQTPEQEKYESLLAEATQVQWEDFNINFINSIYQAEDLDDVAQVMSLSVTETVVQHDLRNRFPKTPRCISVALRTSGPFVFYMPGFYSNYIDYKMLPSTLIVAPLKPSRLSFSTRFDQGSNVFKARLQRLDAGKRDELLQLNEKIYDEMGDCLYAKYSFYCTAFFNAGQKLDQLLDPNSTDSSLYFNEDFIDGNTAGGNEVSIPVCED